MALQGASNANLVHPVLQPAKVFQYLVPEKFLLEIRVRPNASRNKVGGTVGDPPRLVVAVQAPAVDGKANDAVLMLFDIIPLSEFQTGKSVMGQRRRSKLLGTMKGIFDRVGNIGVIPQVEVDLDGYVGELQFKEFNQKAIDEGYEGIMIKDVDAKYECKRSVSWLKMKPFIEVSLAIVDIEEGTGKNEGRLGALICEGEDDGKTIRVNVGSGFTDDQRSEFWADKDNLAGQVIEIRADAATKNQDSEEVYSLRFPRFLRFRGFKAGEKI